MRYQLNPQLDPAPSVRTAMTVRSGIGGLGDFQALVTSNPDFANAWGDVQAQIGAEYAVGTQAYNDAITQAQGMMSDAYAALGQIAGVDSTAIAGKARDYVLLGKTVAGSISTIQGLINDATSGQVTPAVAQAFMGTMVGLAVAFGAVSAGVGAAIVGAIGAIVTFFQQYGLLATAPTGGGNRQICSASANGSDVYIAPNGPRYYNINANRPTLDYSAYVLGFTAGCLGVYVIDPATTQIEPGSLAWRRFPDPTTSADANWFKFGQNDPSTWGDRDMLSWVFTWGGTGNTEAVWCMGWSKPNTDQAFANLNIRPIDAAFPYWRYLECEMAGTPSDFQKAFFQAWKANQEYALNGLKPQSGGHVLVALIRHWNRSHAGPAVPIPATTTPPYQGPCQPTALPLYMSYVTEAQTLAQPTDNIVDANRNLVLNMGAMLKAPFVVRAPLPTTPSVAAKVATGAVVTAGAAALGIGAYALLTHVTFGYAAGKIFDRGVGGIRYLWKKAVRR